MLKLKLSSILLPLLLLVVSNAVFSQQPSTTFFHLYTVKDGLTDNAIRAVFKDSKGFIWISTPNGLNRFDGYTFTKFYHNPADSTTLPSNNVVAIAEDKRGNIWFTLHGGVAKYDYRTARFAKIDLAFEKGFDKPHHIMCDSKGRLWVCSWLGHYVFDEHGKLIKHWRQGRGPRDFPHEHSDFTYEDSKGQIWIGTGGGLCLLNEQAMDFTVYKVDNPPYTKNNGWLNDIGRICEDSSGHLWTTGWANGLRCFDPGTGHFTGYLPTPEFAGEGAFNVVGDIAFFDGHLWLTCDKGLAVFDTAAKKFFFLRDLGFDGYPLPLERTTCLTVTGNILWVGTSSGLYKLDLREQYFEMHKVKGLLHGSCLAQIRPLALIPGQKNKVLFPTWTCGTFEYDLGTRTIKPFLTSEFPGPGEPVRHDFKKVFFDSRKTLWIPSSHGLYRSENGHGDYIRPKEVKSGMIDENYFNNVQEDAKGNIWAASEDGFLFFKNGGKDFIKLKLDSVDKSGGNDVSEIIGDLSVAPNGDVWFLRAEDYEGRKIGFTVYRASQNKFETYTATRGAFKKYPFAFAATSLLVDSSGQVWVTSPRGLIVFQSNDFSNFKLITVTDGLAADNCTSIAQDTKGYIWVACIGGLSRINPKTKSIRNFTTADGLPPGPINSVSAGQNGEVFIGCETEWLLVYKPREFKLSGQPEKVKLVSVTLDDKSILPGDTIYADYNFNYLKLDYSPLNYLLPKDNFFDVEILHNGHVTQYSNATNQLMLSGLEPGIHNIKITAHNTFDTTRSAPALVVFSISPPYWQTWWFKTLIAGSLLLISGIFIWSRFARLKRDEQKRRELNVKIAAAEMNALRSQMNPHFIFNALNAVHRFIWEKKPTEASEYLTKFSRLTRLVLENSREQNVKLSEDLKVLTYYLDLEALNLEHGLVYNISIDENIDPEITLIPPMILQPLVENSLKHGLRGLKTQGRIAIGIRVSNNELVCTIEDNGVGRGFAKVRVEHTSLSTQIIKDRLEVINSIYHSNSRYLYTDKKNENGEPAGTIVELFLPLITDN